MCWFDGGTDYGEQIGAHCGNRPPTVQDAPAVDLRIPGAQLTVLHVPPVSARASQARAPRARQPVPVRSASACWLTRTALLSGVHVCLDLAEMQCRRGFGLFIGYSVSKRPVSENSN